MIDRTWSYNTPPCSCSDVTEIKLERDIYEGSKEWGVIVCRDCDCFIFKEEIEKCNSCSAFTEVERHKSWCPKRK